MHKHITMLCSFLNFQKIEHFRGVHALPHHDWARCMRLFIVGLSQGPLHHIFYIWLDKILPRKNARTVGKKILLDQLLAAPMFAISFFVVAGLLEGKQFYSTLEEFKRKFPAVYLFDWMIWPPSQSINFLYVPVPYRVLYINCITVVWDAFLSYMKHYDQLPPPAEISELQMHHEKTHRLDSKHVDSSCEESCCDEHSKLRDL
ncbi:Mpv17/PMP22 [Trinorchestia longiramus]|nr:Mpv17/PMP22 [Trinorchestia longiramus]